MNQSAEHIESRFPYKCVTHYPYLQVTPWAEENIGQFDRDWYRLGSDIVNGLLGEPQRDEYLFRDERHAVLFRLRWS